MCMFGQKILQHHCLKLFILKNLSWALERKKIADEGLGLGAEMQRGICCCVSKAICARHARDIIIDIVC